MLDTGILPVYNKGLVEINLFSNFGDKNFISVTAFGLIELILIFRVIQISFKINSLKNKEIYVNNIRRDSHKNENYCNNHKL